MDPLNPVPEPKRKKPLPAAESKEQRARESEWENEGGRVRKDETSAAETAKRGNVANDNGAGSA